MSAGHGDRHGADLVPGDHDDTSGAGPWTRQVESPGLQVLRNQHRRGVRGQAQSIVGGVVDPAVRLVDPQRPHGVCPTL